MIGKHIVRTASILMSEPDETTIFYTGIVVPDSGDIRIVSTNITPSSFLKEANFK